MNRTLGYDLLGRRVRVRPTLRAETVLCGILTKLSIEQTADHLVSYRYSIVDDGFEWSSCAYGEVPEVLG